MATRRSGNFKKSIWDYDYIISLNNEFKGNFKEQESNIQNILSLYEASFHSEEDEKILDDARDFALNLLKNYVSNNNNSDNYTCLLINHALEIPLHWRAPKWESHWFINAYEKSHNFNPTLLHFAKLDFNMLQAIYQEELKNIIRWWKGNHFVEKLGFTRDRVLENYFWNMGSNYFPDCGYFRISLSKLACIDNIIDDMYDVHGTLEELKLFTQVIDKWDLSYGMNVLPDYMKLCFLALNNFVNDVAYEFLKDHDGFYIAPYLQKAWANLCKAYMVEAEWYYSGYTPTFEEYMENGWTSIPVPLMYTHDFFTISNSFKKENLVYVAENPNIFRSSGVICRLLNDLVSSKREKDSGDDLPKALECYMLNTGASEVEANEHLKSITYKMWKKINKDARSLPLSAHFKHAILGLTRMVYFMYQHTDGHTDQDPLTKTRIQSLLFEPIPFEC